MKEIIKQVLKDIIIPTILGIILLIIFPKIETITLWSLMFISYGIVVFVRENKRLKNKNILDTKEEDSIIHNNSLSITKEQKPTLMTEKEKLVIDKLYALLGTKEVYSSHSSFSSNHYVYYYGFTIDDKNTVQILKITRDEKTYYEVVNSTSKDYTKVLENPSIEAMLQLEKIIERIKEKIDIQNLEKEQEKLDNFLKL